MKKTEFIRKMDSMGRIVIPKDLRKELNIKDEDNVVLSLNDEHIELNKFQFDNQINMVNEFISRSKDLIDSDVYLFNPESCINNKDNKKLILETIKDRKDYYSSTIESLYINEHVIDGFLGLIPLISESNIIGILIIRKDCILNDFDKLYINLIKRFVENINYL